MSRARIASILTLSALALAAGAATWHVGLGKGTRDATPVVKQGEQKQRATPSTPEEQAAWLNARARSYDSYLEKQSRDDNWASQIEAKAVAATRKQKDLGVKLAEARCWSSACRFRFSYPDVKARTQHVYTLGQLFPELPVISYSYPGEPQEHTRVIAYLSKESLPQSAGK